jgi:hypothetical protein
MATLEVVQFPARPNEWDDDIQRFPTKTLFHESAWLDFVQTIHPRGGIEYVEIRQGVTKRIASLELASDWLDPPRMRELGFKVDTSITNVCSLVPDEPGVWAALKGTCRTRIRKAEKSGLEAEITDDVAIVDDFYRYYTRILKRRKFGGKDVQYNSYRRDFVPFLETARNLYHLFSFRKSGGTPDTLSA